jgi:hypothetical protein
MLILLASVRYSHGTLPFVMSRIMNVAKLLLVVSFSVFEPKNHGSMPALSYDL